MVPNVKEGLSKVLADVPKVAAALVLMGVTIGLLLFGVGFAIAMVIFKR